MAEVEVERWEMGDIQEDEMCEMSLMNGDG